MLNLMAIRTNDGYYLTDNTESQGYFYTKLKEYFLDGEKPSATFHKDWFFVKNIPEKIEKPGTKNRINIRYKLMDLSFSSEKCPAELSVDEATYLDDEGIRHFRDRYAMFESLYQYVYDMSDGSPENVEFQVEIVMELEDVKPPMQLGFFNGKEIPYIVNDKIKHSLLGEIMVPSLILHTTPCTISSRELYNVLRQYIKTNINPRYAQVVGDYDFCFSVEKTIYINRPFENKKELLRKNGKSFSPKQYKNTFVNSRKIRIFEMCPSPYQGYTVVKPISAKNEDELVDMIQKLCEETIELINLPVVDCPTCDGLGVIFKEKEDK